MKKLADNSIDLVFADPPFNLKKDYQNQFSDNLSEQEYEKFQERWILEALRTLKPGGSFFVYNTPKWNSLASAFLMKQGMTFRHWIAVEFKSSLPIKGRLYPSHYSLLYFSKGRPGTFEPDRLPIRACRHCEGDIADYGGHRDKLNPNGINLSDVWTDISPVRHKGKKHRGANELPLRLVDRVIQMASEEGDTVLDPFAGAGTSGVVCKLKNRNWIGIEIGDVELIRSRLDGAESEREFLGKLRGGLNRLEAA